jgi:hypothetical protein
MCFLSLDLARVENNLLRCYEIAEKACHYRGEGSAGSFEHQIYHSPIVEDAQATKQIEGSIGSFHNDSTGDAV